jgi:post-segregation antitoxin (ccd killing protein)
MARKKELDNLVRTSVKIEKKMLHRVKRRGINLSELLREAIAGRLARED